MTPRLKQEALKVEFRKRVKDWYLARPETSRPDLRLHLSNFPELEPILVKHYDTLIDCFDRVLEKANQRLGRDLNKAERHLYDDILKAELPPVLYALWNDLKPHKDAINQKLKELGVAPTFRFDESTLFYCVVWEAMQTYERNLGFGMNILKEDVGTMVSP